MSEDVGTLLTLQKRSLNMLKLPHRTSLGLRGTVTFTFGRAVADETAAQALETAAYEISLLYD